MLIWVIRPRPGSALLEMRPHGERIEDWTWDSEDWWYELPAVILATSRVAARAMLPAGSLLLGVSGPGDAEWWVPWYAPGWLWPDGQRPANAWSAPAVRERLTS